MQHSWQQPKTKWPYELWKKKSLVKLLREMQIINGSLVGRKQWDISQTEEIDSDVLLLLL